LTQRRRQSGTSLLDYTTIKHSWKAHGFFDKRRTLQRSYLQLYLKIHCGKAKHFAIRENQDVEGTINLLQSYELAPQSIPEETPVTAALAREQRSRGRKDKDRGRD